MKTFLICPVKGVDQSDNVDWVKWTVERAGTPEGDAMVLGCHRGLSWTRCDRASSSSDRRSGSASLCGANIRLDAPPPARRGGSYCPWPGTIR